MAKLVGAFAASHAPLMAVNVAHDAARRQAGEVDAVGARPGRVHEPQRATARVAPRRFERAPYEGVGRSEQHGHRLVAFVLKSRERVRNRQRRAQLGGKILVHGNS